MNALERIENKISNEYSNKRHVETAADGVYMAAMRTGADVDALLNDIDAGTAFDWEGFLTAERGNVADFTKYAEVMNRLVNITAGGNGGMASLGRGEFAIAFMSNFDVKISTSGKGDLEYKELELFEEVKHNGGKVAVAQKAGNEITRTMKRLLDDAGVELKTKDFIPFRNTNTKTYTTEEINVLNGYYLAALTDAEFAGAITDEELTRTFITLAMEASFKKSDTLLVMNTENDFVRFTDAETAIEYYVEAAKTRNGMFEIRAAQQNLVALYTKYYG